jgi:hypothetical protein
MIPLIGGPRLDSAWCLAILAVSLLSLVMATPARGWDSRTHRLIARLAIAGLPDGVVKTSFRRNTAQLEEFSVEPDTVLRPLYGLAEGRRHYIDLENFGAEPFARLIPDFTAMERTYGQAQFDRSGTLPWSIEDEAGQMETTWRAGDCPTMFRHAGYLAHYVGDASQPLHTTRFYDGYTAADRGLHARLESSVDSRIQEFEDIDRGRAHAQSISTVWTPVIAELKQANTLVPQTIESDRALRDTTSSRAAYTDALMAREQDMVASQLVSGASTLGSIWLFEWHEAGSPSACGATL